AEPAGLDTSSRRPAGRHREGCNTFVCRRGAARTRVETRCSACSTRVDVRHRCGSLVDRTFSVARLSHVRHGVFLQSPSPSIPTDNTRPLMILARIPAMRIAVLALAVVLAVALTACGGAESRRASHMERGQKFYDAGNYDKARVEFRNALQISPNDPEARYMNGRIA